MGRQVRLLDNSELMKAEGALTCCSLVFEGYCNTAGLLEVAGLDEDQGGRVDVLAEGRGDLVGSERGHLGFQGFVELQGAVEALAGGEEADQRTIFGAAHAALLQPGLLGGGDFVGGEAFLERLGEFVAEAGFHLGSVLRSADGEARKLPPSSLVGAPNCEPTP